MNAILFLALAALGPSADPKVTFVDEGFQYPVVTEVTSEKKTTQHTCFGFGKKQAPGFTLKPGKHTLLSRNSTRGFPQGVEYVLRDNKGNVSWESGVTVDHKSITLQADETLEIRVQRPFASYNCQKIKIKGVETPILLVGARAYWFYYADKGQFPLDAPEQYSNGIFFLADPKWGVEGVAKDLAKKVYDDLQKKDYEAYDHRGSCHWSVLHGTEPDGKVPVALRQVKQADWEAAIKTSFQTLLSNNYYRPFDAETVKALKEGEWLPKETPDRAMVITLGQGVEYGKLYRQRWLDQRAAEKKEADKKK